MNYQFIYRKLALFGSISLIAIIPVFADDWIVKDAASFESCQDKNVIASGPRAGMFDVPEYFMLADPNFTGGSGIQDYMAIGETQVILHTKEEVQCPDTIEVKGTLKHKDLEGQKAWVISVTEFKCL